MRQSTTFERPLSYLGRLDVKELDQLNRTAQEVILRLQYLTRPNPATKGITTEDKYRIRMEMEAGHNDNI